MQFVDLKCPGEPRTIGDCGLILGNFDGVHRGHLALIDELKRLNASRERPVPLGALCFTHHPSYYLSTTPTRMLCSNEDKLEIFRRAGLSFVVFYDFPELKDLSPEDFVIQILIKQLHCKLAVCGFNYSFGARGAGKAEDLQRMLCAQPSAAVSILPPVMHGDQPISSTRIRELLRDGRPEDATLLLGRPYSLVGTVDHGRKIGRMMGYPTANLSFPENALIPRYGVYAVHVRLGKRTYCGVCNIGTRPTFSDSDEPSCETFLLDFDGTIYGKQMRVSFLEFLREERVFQSVEELQIQIKRDIVHAKYYL